MTESDLSRVINNLHTLSQLGPNQEDNSSRDKAEVAKYEPGKDKVDFIAETQQLLNELGIELGNSREEQSVLHFLSNNVWDKGSEKQLPALDARFKKEVLESKQKKTEEFRRKRHNEAVDTVATLRGGEYLISDSGKRMVNLMTILGRPPFDDFQDTVQRLERVNTEALEGVAVLSSGMARLLETQYGYIAHQMIDIRSLFYANNVSQNNGDRLLREASIFLMKRFPGFKLCRWGGDEFAILGPRGSSLTFEELEEAQRELNQMQFVYKSSDTMYVEKVDFEAKKYVPVGREQKMGEYDASQYASRKKKLAQYYPNLNVLSSPELTFSSEEMEGRLLDLLESSAYHPILQEKVNFMNRNEHVITLVKEPEAFVAALGTLPTVIYSVGSKQFDPPIRVRYHLVRVDNPGMMKIANDEGGYNKGNQFMSDEFGRTIDTLNIGLSLDQTVKSLGISTCILVRGGDSFISVAEIVGPSSQTQSEDDEAMPVHQRHLGMNRYDAKIMSYLSQNLTEGGPLIHDITVRSPKGQDTEYSYFTASASLTILDELMASQKPTDNTRDELSAYLAEGDQDEKNMERKMQIFYQYLDALSSITSNMFLEETTLYVHDKLSKLGEDSEKTNEVLENDGLFNLLYHYYNPFEKRGIVRLQKIGIQCECDKQTGMALLTVDTNIFDTTKDNSLTLHFDLVKITEKKEQFVLSKSNEDALLKFLQMIEECAARKLISEQNTERELGRDIPKIPEETSQNTGEQIYTSQVIQLAKLRARRLMNDLANRKKAA